MKNYLVLVLFFIASFSFSQTSWIDSDISRESDANTPKDVLPIVNADTQELALFFKARRVIFAKLYNENQELIGSINAVNLPKKAKLLIGAIYNNNVYTLFFSNSRNTHFSALSINIKKKSFNINDDLGIEFDNEKVLEFLVDNNTVNILTIDKRNSIFRTYNLVDNQKISAKTFDFSQYSIKTNKDYEYNLYDLIIGNPSYSTVEIVDNDIPNSLEKTAAFTKIYYKKGKLTITNNLFDKYTYFFKIDLNNNTNSFDVFENVNYSKNNLSSNSNSYILNNYFFSIYSTTKHLDFTVYNLKEKTLIKAFKIEKGQPITFKNTPIIQEGGEFDSYRELEKTSKFLRKVTTSKIGICAYEKDNDLVVTLGASEQVQTAPAFSVAAGGAIGGIITGIIYSSYNSYTHTKSTRIECLFNSDLDHKIGEIPQNDFNKIDKFKTIYKLENAKLQTVFKYKDKLVLGTLDNKADIFKLYAFE